MATLTLANITTRLNHAFKDRLQNTALYQLLYNYIYTDIAALEARALLLETYTPISATAATLSVTAATHHGKTVFLNRTAGIEVTLPAATGSGTTVTFIVAATAATGNYVIEVADATDEFIGALVGLDADAATTLRHWIPADNDDTVTMNGVATGGKLGDMITVRDVATNVWHITGHISQSGGSEATPFSNAVS